MVDEPPDCRVAVLADPIVGQPELEGLKKKTEPPNKWGLGFGFGF
jgi:hypothetical protein